MKHRKIPFQIAMAGSLLVLLLLTCCAPGPQDRWQKIPATELSQHPLLAFLQKEIKLEENHRVDFRQLRVFRYSLPLFQELLLVEQSSLLILDNHGNAHTNLYFPATFRPVSSLYLAGREIVVPLLTGEIQLPSHRQ